MILFVVFALWLTEANIERNCKNFGRKVKGVCECTPNYTGETCETRRTYEGFRGVSWWQWYVIWTNGDTCEDRGYLPIRNAIECMIAARELYNWDIHKMAMTRFDKEGFPGCWTKPGVGSIGLNDNFITAAGKIKKWDMTKKLVCKHLIDEAVPPQVKSRLVNGTTGQPSAGNKGLLQVWSLDWNYWVGDTSDHNLVAVANLACVEMGYSGVESLRGNQLTPNKWQDTMDEIMIEDFNCTGSESSLFQCDYVKGFGFHEHAIEVTCSNPTRDTTFDPMTAPTSNPTANPTADTTAKTWEVLENAACASHFFVSRFCSGFEECKNKCLVWDDCYGVQHGPLGWEAVDCGQHLDGVLTPPAEDNSSTFYVRPQGLDLDPSICVKHRGKWSSAEVGSCCGIPGSISCGIGFVAIADSTCGGSCPENWCNHKGVLSKVRDHRCVPTDDPNNSGIDPSVCVKNADLGVFGAQYGSCCGLPGEITCGTGYVAIADSTCGGSCPKNWCNHKGALSNAREHRCVPESTAIPNNPITNNPTMAPTATPTNNPTTNPTFAPTVSPTANPTVPRSTHIGTGINSCNWEHQIRELTSFVSKEECALACSENAECKAFYTFVKNPFSRKPLCVGFSQACTRKFSSSCPDNAWCGYNVIQYEFVQGGLCGEDWKDMMRGAIELSWIGEERAKDPSECAKLAAENSKCGSYYVQRNDYHRCWCMAKQGVHADCSTRDDWQIHSSGKSYGSIYKLVGDSVTDWACLIDGAPNGGTFYPDVLDPNPAEALGEIQCCHASHGCSRRNPWDSTTNEDCISGSSTVKKYNFQEAKDMCDALGSGWGLCTRQEIYSNICSSKGCQHDNDIVWALCPQSFDFELRGHVGDELVIITDGEDTHTATLSTDYKAFSAINENIVITFKNDIGPRDVYFKSSVHTNIRSDGLFSQWNCGTSNENIRCQWVRDGKFLWKADYQITFDRAENGRRMLKTHRF